MSMRRIADAELTMII